MSLAINNQLNSAAQDLNMSLPLTSHMHPRYKQRTYEQDARDTATRK